MTVNEDEDEGWEPRSETSGEEENGSDTERNLDTPIEGEVTQTPEQPKGDTKPQAVLAPATVSKRERRPANTSCRPSDTSCRPSEYARYDTTTPCLQ